jgi:mRNA interferase HicA
LKRFDLERHLGAHGCTLAREGGNHAIWRNPANGKVAPVPRHREVKEGTLAQSVGNWKFQSREPLRLRAFYSLPGKGLNVFTIPISE